jgi:hypothetical protein
MNPTESEQNQEEEDEEVEELHLELDHDPQRPLTFQETCLYYITRFKNWFFTGIPYRVCCVITLMAFIWFEIILICFAFLNISEYYYQQSLFIRDSGILKYLDTILANRTTPCNCNSSQSFKFSVL